MSTVAISIPSFTVFALFALSLTFMVIGIDFAEAMIQRALQAVAEAGLQDRNILVSV
jgi:predicted O-methyltransferase YrrM